MKKPVLTLMSFLISLSAISQRDITASRITSEVVIDGKLDDEAWSNAEVATDFINWQPLAGSDPSNATEVKILYDDRAIYVGAYMKNDSREEIQTELAERDNIGNTDWFGFVLDTYGNGNDGSEFIISATGVQFDAKVSANGEDENWNEVWYSAVELTEKGWYAELKIPYFALRFPKSKKQNWRVNFMRRMAATGEKCSFQYIDPLIDGFVNQSAILKGVSDIKSPIRLALSPYVTGYVQHNNTGGENAASSTGYSYNGGLDLKYGINEAFTLDMTLIPDFGQVQSDDLVLNLSPFEVRYAENRAFFTEGIELFSRANLFYTRRVGGQPVGYWDASNHAQHNEELIENPGETQLYNATKISGRTSSGLGIGVFNAVAGSTQATLRNNETDEVRKVMTGPLTNYNVLVFDKNLPNNSYVSLINTNVYRKGKEFYNANVTGTEFDIRTKNQKWGISGDASVSQLIFAEDDNINGLKYNVEFGKISGNWGFDISVAGKSKNYNNNDLGYVTETNIREYDFGTYYRITEGWKFMDRGNFWFNAFVNTTYDQNKFSSIHFNTGFWFQTKQQWNFNMWTNYRPYTNDFYEPREDGRFLYRPGFYNMGWWIGSDQRKKLRVSASVFGLKFFEEGSGVFSFNVNPRYRFTDKFTIFLGFDTNYDYHVRGWADMDDNNDPIIGMRDQVTVNNSIGINYTLNSTMALNFRARHYWSTVVYNSFHSLGEDGRLGMTDYNQFNDFSFNLFNIDLNYTWRFAPGSDIIVVWKNSIAGGENSELIDFSERSYADGVRSLVDLPQTNSISVRLVYFLNAANYL